MSKRVLIVGEAPFVDSMAVICNDARHRVDSYLVSELDDQDNLNDMVRAATRCDVFIESLNESLANKLWLIEGVEANLRDDAIILTHTLCTTATDVASWCSHPERVVGYGLLPPLTAPCPIEFAPAMQTDYQTSTQARDFLEKLRLEVVRVPDTPALVRGRLLICLINEAIFALDNKIARAEDIDRAMQLGKNYPRGLLEWADLLGLDVILGTLKGLHEFYGEERYRAAPLLRQKVRAGHLGRKAGRGFFIDPVVVPPED